MSDAPASRGSLRAGVQRAVLAIPTWVWLAAIVSVSAAIRYALGTHTPAPWIFDDELLYSELASSFGSTAVSYTHLTLPTTPYV